MQNSFSERIYLDINVIDEYEKLVTKLDSKVICVIEHPAYKKILCPISSATNWLNP